MLLAVCGPFCALQACCEGVQVEIDIFDSSTSIITLDHKKKLKNNTFVGNTGHYDNEFDFASAEGLGHQASEVRFVFPVVLWVICCITPLALQMWRFNGFFALFPDFKKVWSSAASAEMTRQVEISTLSAHQMAHGGVVPHSSSWTLAACELEESSPPSNLHIGGLSANLPTSRRPAC